MVEGPGPTGRWMKKIASSWYILGEKIRDNGLTLKSNMAYFVSFLGFKSQQYLQISKDVHGFTMISAKYHQYLSFLFPLKLNHANLHLTPLGSAWRLDGVAVGMANGEAGVVHRPYASVHSMATRYLHWDPWGMGKNIYG